MRGEGREKDNERNIDVWEKHWSAASCILPAGDLATTRHVPQPGNGPATFELSLQVGTQPTEPHQQELNQKKF